MPINPKKYSCYDRKKNHTRNLIAKKNSCGSKIPHFPHNIFNGPSLILLDFLNNSLLLEISVLVTHALLNMRNGN